MRRCACTRNRSQQQREQVGHVDLAATVDVGIGVGRAVGRQEQQQVGNIDLTAVVDVCAGVLKLAPRCVCCVGRGGQAEQGDGELAKHAWG
jgi:hypothetical protein